MLRAVNSGNVPARGTWRRQPTSAYAGGGVGLLVSLIAAVIAAVFYGVASVMQAIAVRAASNRPPGEANAGVDPGLVVRLLHQWRFVVSLGLDAFGFIAQLVALHRL